MLGVQRQAAVLSTPQENHVRSVEALLREIVPIYRRHITGNRERPICDAYKYLEDVLDGLARHAQADLRSHDKLSVISSFDSQIWLQFPPLQAIESALTETLTALGELMLDKGLYEKHGTLLPPSISNPEAAYSAVLHLLNQVMAAGYPEHMMIDSQTTALTSLCAAWVRHKYGFSLQSIENFNRTDTTSSKLTLKAAMSSSFMPVARAFADIVRVQQRKSANPASSQIRLQARADSGWQEFAMLYLGKQRAQQAWEILHIEDQNIRNYLLADIAEIAAHPKGRASINNGLQTSFRRHLLHPGSSTVAILDEFMLIIKTLTTRLTSGKKVDETGVILDLAADSIRTFLRTRDDAARIVIQSLLDPQPGDGNSPPPSTDGFSGRVSMAMYHQKDPQSTVRPYEGQDLLDINWTPKPIDARPTHGDNNSKDDIGHVTSIQEDATFVKELEEVLAERLLKSDQEYFDVEGRLLAMFRARFDEETGDKTLIQRSDVMLWDMMQSLNFGETMGNDFKRPHLPDTQVRILSLESWNNVKERETSEFHFPLKGLSQQWTGISGWFEHLSGDERYLELFPELGRMTVELTLTDRVIKEEVTPPQAAVLHAFSEDLPDGFRYRAPDQPQQRTVEQLSTSLHMSEGLVRESLAFWVGQMVLRRMQDQHDTYVVLETLSNEEAQQQASDAADAQAEVEEATAASSHRERLESHAAMYSAFIMGMLTNLGSMPAEDIFQNLSYVVPGGFAFDQNDLELLLQDMAEKGEVQREGIMWKMVEDDEEL